MTNLFGAIDISGELNFSSRWTTQLAPFRSVFPDLFPVYGSDRLVLFQRQRNPGNLLADGLFVTWLGGVRHNIVD
jgi:hypothetical protein